MQFGMIGLGRMGANMVRRLMKSGHKCVVYDRLADVVSGWRRRAPRARPSPTSSEARPPRSQVWMMVPAAFVDSTIEELEKLLAGRHHHRRRKLLLPRRHPPREAPQAEGDPLRRHGHERRGLGPRARILPDDRRRDRDRQAPRPDLPDARPRRGRHPRTPGRDKLGGTAEKGYLHCGPSGAGHFVKMVHNGIEYGLMAAYAEGLNILQARQHRQGHPREGRRDHAAPESRALSVRLQPRRRDRGLAARQRHLVVAPGPDGAGLRRRARTSRNSAASVSDSGEGRWTVAAAIDEAVPAHVLTAALFERFARAGRTTSRTRCSRRCASASAGTSRSRPK